MGMIESRRERKRITKGKSKSKRLRERKKQKKYQRNKRRENEDTIREKKRKNNIIRNIQIEEIKIKEKLKRNWREGHNTNTNLHTIKQQEKLSLKTKIKSSRYCAKETESVSEWLMEKQ